MQSGSWERYAPLTGAIFVVIVVIAFIIGGDTPGAHDSAVKAEAFYSKHRDQQTAVAFLVALGAAFLPFFVASLRRTLDWAGGTGRLANASFAGGAIATAGFFFTATVHLALADGAGKTTPQVTQTLNVLDNNSFIPLAGGLGVFMIATGLSALRYRGLPTWLGWAALVLGVLIFTPAGFVGFFGAGIWILVTSLLLFQAGPFVEDPGRAGVTTT